MSACRASAVPICCPLSQWHQSASDQPACLLALAQAHEYLLMVIDTISKDEVDALAKSLLSYLSHYNQEQKVGWKEGWPAACSCGLEGAVADANCDQLLLFGGACTAPDCALSCALQAGASLPLTAAAAGGV